MNFKPSFNDSAVIYKQRLMFNFGKWHLYEVQGQTKTYKLLVDHEIRERYSNLHRLTDYFFIGLEKYER